MTGVQTCALPISQSNSETKNVSVSAVIQVNPDLGAGMESGAFVAPGLQTANLATATISADGTPVEVTGYTTQLAYDSSKIQPNQSQPAEPLPPFDSFFDVFFDIGQGTMTVSAGSAGPVPLIPGADPTPLFTANWDVQPFTTADIAYVDANTEFTTTDPNNKAVPNRTEYLIGSSLSCSPHLRIADEAEWRQALIENVSAISEEQWQAYVDQMKDPYNDREGEPYPETTFLPPEGATGDLYVYPGGSGQDFNDPCDADRKSVV